MSEATMYQTITQSAVAEFKDRGSKFFAHAQPLASVDDFKRSLQQLKKDHPKAVHHCFAYRLGIDGNVFRVSDDGEPAGTAGRPILGQIDSKSLTNLSIIVVRYFGGTLLGVPGLIHAYQSAASMALQLIPIVTKPIEIVYELQFDYTRMNEVMLLVKQFGCSVVNQEIQLFCVLQVGIPKARLEEVLYKLQDLHTVNIAPKP